jgi:hypothetical protein
MFRPLTYRSRRRPVYLRGGGPAPSPSPDPDPGAGLGGKKGGGQASGLTSTRGQQAAADAAGMAAAVAAAEQTSSPEAEFSTDPDFSEAGHFQSVRDSISEAISRAPPGSTVMDNIISFAANLAHPLAGLVMSGYNTAKDAKHNAAVNALKAEFEGTPYGDYSARLAAENQTGLLGLLGSLGAPSGPSTAPDSGGPLGGIASLLPNQANVANFPTASPASILPITSSFQPTGPITIGNPLIPTTFPLV